MRHHLCARAATAVALIAALSALAGQARDAHADDFHYENFRFGQEALGMGGAMEGVPGIPEGAYYNPSSLGFIESPELAAAFNFYGSDTRVLRDGLNATVQFCCQNEGDLVSNEFLPVPSSSVFVFPLGQHVLAFSTFVTSDTNESFLSEYNFRQAQERYNLITGRKRSDQMFYVGPSYAYRLADSLSIGVSAFVVSRTQETTFTYGSSYTSILQAINGTSINASSDVRIDDYAMRARLGAMWKSPFGVNLGLSITSPSVNLAGSGSALLTVNQVIPDEEIDNKTFTKLSDLEATTDYPLHAAFGASYTLKDTVRLLGAVSAHMPSSYQRLATGGSVQVGDEQLSEAAFLRLAQFNNTIDRETVINYKAGAELLMVPWLNVRTGFYTNFSAAPDIPDGEFDGRRSAQVDLYGITASLGYLGDDVSITGGINYEFGEGFDSVPLDSNAPFEDFTRVERAEQRFIFFLAGDIEFIDNIKDNINDIQNMKDNLQDTLKGDIDLKPDLTPKPEEPAPTPAPDGGAP